ncbi:MAG TPA: MFS transporter [Streptosporangiaceae bacterium]
MSVLRSFSRNVIPPAGIVRLLAVSNLAKTTANGVIMAVSVLYFTRVVGIPAQQVGLALTLGAAIGMLFSVPAGRAADVQGPRKVTVVLLVVLGVAACSYAAVSGFVGLVVATAAVLGLDSAAQASRGALLAGLLSGEERPRALAYMRSMANIGVSLGAVAGGLGLLIDSRAGYLALFLVAGALFAVSGMAFLRVPAVPGGPSTQEGPSLPVLRDHPYAVVSLLNAVLVMSDPVLTVAVPVWISQHTSAPPFFYTVVLLINTAVVILFQVRVSKGTESVPGGALAWVRSGVALAICCAVFALAAGRPVWLACVLLLVGALVHVLGEMLHGAGAWSLSFGLAPEGAHGQYQGLFEMSTQLGTTLAPLAITAALTGLGGLGWAVFAGMFLFAGASARPLSAWAVRTRTPVPEPAIGTES